MKLYPSWKSNLALFIVLIVLVAGYFFLQLQKASNQFHKHSREHSEVVAGIVELNIRNTINSSASLESIYKGFLKNSARFLFYLDSIEPFTDRELSAFATETGLAGVKILRDTTDVVSGPGSWLPDQSCLSSGQLLYREDKGVYLFSYTDGEQQAVGENGCIIVGISSTDYEQMRQNLSLETLLTVLNTLPGIGYVKFELPQDSSEEIQRGKLKSIKEGETIAEHDVLIGGKRLVVGLKAEHFEKRMAQMRKELSLFVLFLLAIGSFSSWWLYRSQKTRLNEARDFERQLARQHEEAALGRAASTITHELRNPLNAINIGLQRLQFEADDLSQEHRQLLDAMREAVKRSDNVINRLRQYIHDFQIEAGPVNLSELILQVIEPYRSAITDQSIELELNIDGSLTVEGDRELLGQLFENILRNGIEAQADGGFLSLYAKKEKSLCLITARNGGFDLTKEQGEKLFQPYFTTKAKGTGLGLSISRKIVEAHKGSISWIGDYPNRELTMTVSLPLKASGPRDDDYQAG